MRNAGKYAVTVHTSTYGAWEDGADERELLDTDPQVYSFDHLREVAEFLSGRGLDSPSESAPYRIHTWLSLADGDQPTWDGNYTGEVEEVSAHPANHWTEREWTALLRYLVHGAAFQRNRADWMAETGQL